MGIKHATTADGTIINDPTTWAENHTIDGDVLPDTDDTHDLGSSTYRWAEGYFQALKDLEVLQQMTGQDIIIKDKDGTSRFMFSGLTAATFAINPVTASTGYLGTALKPWKAMYTEIGSIYAQTLFFDQTGADYNPGDTNYHTIAGTTSKGCFANFPTAYVRLTAYVDADEAGTKYLKLVGSTSGTIYEHSWGGAAAGITDSDWQSFSASADENIYIQYKASTVTETVTLYNIQVQFRTA